MELCAEKPSLRRSVSISANVLELPQSPSLSMSCKFQMSGVSRSLTNGGTVLNYCHRCCRCCCDLGFSGTKVVTVELYSFVPDVTRRGELKMPYSHGVDSKVGNPSAVIQTQEGWQRQYADRTGESINWQTRTKLRCIITSV